MKTSAAIVPAPTRQSTASRIGPDSRSTQLHRARLVFDPGGLGWFVAAPEDFRQRKPKTCDNVITTRLSLPTSHNDFGTRSTQFHRARLVSTPEVSRSLSINTRRWTLALASRRRVAPLPSLAPPSHLRFMSRFHCFSSEPSNFFSRSS